MIFDRRLSAAAALACLILGGCERKAAEGTKATGEVLEGTITDAMIATDEVRSEPPLAPQTAKAGDEADAEEAPAVETSRPEDITPAPKTAASEPAG